MWSQVGLSKYHYDKASGGDEIPVELFQILKDDAVKVLHSIYQQIWKIQQWPQDWKRSVCILIPKKGNAKQWSNYQQLYSSHMPVNLENSAVATGLEKVSFHSNAKERQCKRMLKLPTIVLISHASKVILKILQARLQQYVNHELRCSSWFLKRQRNQRSNCQHLLNHWKAREFQKNIYFCFIDYAKALTAWITINCGKFWKRWEYQTTWPASWETSMHVRKQQLELDMEQQTGYK